MNGHQIIKVALILLLPSFLGFFIPTCSSAQRIGNPAEMDRLEQQAEDLAAQSDPEGAALAIGKAAMMADLIAEHEMQLNKKTLFQSASHLYRAQELAFQALSLFERAGGQPPAPAGVCHYLIQGNHRLQKSSALLEAQFDVQEKSLLTRQADIHDKNSEWKVLLQELYQDLDCPESEGLDQETDRL